MSEIKPELRFSEFKDEWENKKLENIADFTKGKLLGKKDLIEKGRYPCILYGELYTKYGPIINDVVSRTDVNKDKLKKGSKNQILIPSSGETTEDIAIASTLNTNKDVYIGGDLNILTPKNEDGKFISLSLNGINKWNMAKLAQGKTVVHLYNNDIKTLNINLPNKIQEQQKIGDFFSKLDRQIELEELKLAKLEEQKKGYMQKIFSQELRFKDGSGNEYPEWEEVKLQNIANIKKGEQIKKENIDNNGKYYHLNGGTTASSRTNLFNTNPFTISISEGGNSCGFIKMNKEYFFSGGHNYTLLDLSVSNFYLYAYLKYHEKKIMSLRVGSGLPNIQKKDISNYLIKIPRKEEQEKIGSFFKNLDEFIEKQANKVELLKQRKQSFLQKMFV